MRQKHFILALVAMLLSFVHPAFAQAENVAKVGNTEYATIAEAISAAQAGETVTLLADINLSEILVLDKAITLDGNGKKLTSTAGRAINVSGADGVTIKNLTINASGERAINVIQNATNVTIDGVTATAANYTVNLASSAGAAKVAISNSNLTGLNVVNVGAPGSEITINGGTITCNDQTDAENYAALALNKDGKNATIAATGVTFDIKGDSKKASNGAEGGVITINGSTDEVAVDVAYISAEGNYYNAFTSIEAAIEAANAGQTIVLIRDITASDIITINKAITLDGNNKILTSTAGRAINVSGADGVTIKNLTINASGERAINVIQNATNVTIENVTATAANYTVNVAASAPNAVVAINNSTLNGLCTVNVAAAGADVTIEGSTVNCNDNNTTVGEAYAALSLNKDAVGGSIVATNTTVNVTAGSDSMKGRNNAENGTVSINGSTDDVAVMVAVITYEGSPYYYSFATLDDAIEYAKAGDVVTLIRDVEASNIITINKAITLDGNGKTLTYTGYGTSARAIDVPAADGVNLEVTIKNLTVDCTSSYCQRGINYNEDGKLTLEGVTVKGTNVTYALNLPGSSDNAEVTINNSSLTGNIALNIWGANSQITATNSVFTSVDNNTAEGYVAISLNNDGAGNAATGSVVTINGGKIIAKDENGNPSTAVRVETVATVNVSEETEVVGSIKRDVAIVTYEGSTDFYSFDNLQSAINKAIESKGTVVLLADVTIDELVKIEKDITIDLNGKKVTSTAKKAFEVYANTTIKNGTIEAAQRCVDTRKAVELTLTDVTLIADEYTTHGNPQPLTIGGSENGTKVVMTNVDISAAAGYGIITFVETELTATNSTIGGYNALYVKPGSDNSTFNFVDSDLSGSTVSNDVEGNSFSTIAVRANNVAVNVDAESTVTANGNYSFAISFIGGSENTTTGSSVTVAGDITGNILDDPNGNTVKVKAEYADKLADAGYATIEAENGLVAAIKAVAKIGDAQFETLADAVAAAQAGETVTLLADVETADGIVITDKNLVIDLNGKTYTTTEGASTNSRNFKIEGTSVVTIKNGTMVAAGDYSSGAYGTVRTEGSANVTLEGLKLYNYRGNGLNIKACAGTTVTVKDTEIYANYGGGIESAGGTIVVDNVTVEQKGMYTAPYNSMAISVNGGGKVTVNSGTYSTECITAEEANNQGTSHGPWVAGVLNSGGTLIINGGTFSNDNFGENSLATYARGAILADTKAKVEINGGKFNVLKNVIDIQNNLGDANNNPSVVLAGGTYNADPRISASYSSNLITLADGYAALPDLNGNYVVGVKPTATVNNLGMTTVAAGDYSIWNGSFDQNTEDDGNMPLSFVMQFLADQDAEDMETSPYADWYGDFVLTFTGIENGSFTADGCYLAGHYGSFGWVKVPVDGMTIEEGVRYPVMLGVGLGQKYDYICSSVEDFKCALYLTPEILAANPNIKVNLELAVVDNSKGSDAAASALVNNENVYSVTDYTYEAKDFDPDFTRELTIVDGEIDQFVNDAEKTVEKLTYKRTFAAGLWNPLFVPFEIPVSALTEKGYEVAYINDLHAADLNGDGKIVPGEDDMAVEYIKLTSGILRANHPYVIKPGNEAETPMELVLENAVLRKTTEKVSVSFSSAYVEYEVHGTYVKANRQELTGGKNCLVINPDGAWQNLSSDTSTKLGAFRLYMEMESKNGSPLYVPENVQIRARVIGEKDEVTGIYTPYVSESFAKEGIFDLMGRPVITPEKGKLYIIDGKKVLY